ncbi:plasma-membrane proton-efflux P-type ATPase [Comamonas faecalis]|uniref:Plasma-membrane proton-efflux P-type ATPase n=1 Tax=Comamonas faecalis TaxID=1387849 RepID=A0ABP7R6R0_9BURK
MGSNEQQTTPQAPQPGEGLSSAQAAAALQQWGANAVEVVRESLARRALSKLWAPIPWMLEAAALLQLWLGKPLEAALIAALIVFNVVIALIQEGRAQAALGALQTHLQLKVQVLRDGAWRRLPARELVPGDLVALGMGGVVPADVQLVSGSALLDLSTLTGESAPAAVQAGDSAWAGTLVQRGQAQARVVATGARTRFARTAELVRTAHVVGTQQVAVLRVVRNLALFNGLVIAAVIAHAWWQGMQLALVEPVVLTALLASIPISLPATFTMAAAIAAHALARRGVLATRLSALDEAGSIDVLCSDKTGTLTRNTLQVQQVLAFGGSDEAQVLALAAQASSEAGADPVDAAVRSASAQAAQKAQAGRGSGAPALRRLAFEPFDPAAKRAQARMEDGQGRAFTVVKGAFEVIADAVGASAAQHAAAEQLQRQGSRVLGVGVQEEGGARLIGLIALSDPPRDDAGALIDRLHAQGVRVMMVTGDAPTTAAVVARAVGIRGGMCERVPDGTGGSDGARWRMDDGCAVLAGVLPQDKFHLVQQLQRAGHTVGMCGDGTNDAPALRQAHMGIAVAQATDVARAAAGLVLTQPGLGGILDAIGEGRETFQRVQTYTLNSIIKKVATVLFIAAGFVLTGHAVLTPLLMIVLLVAGDFLSMAITTDRVRASPRPNVWRIGALTWAAVILGLVQLAFALGVLLVGQRVLHLAPDALVTLSFATLVFAGQATMYVIRTRHHLWDSAPSVAMLAATLVDLVIATMVAMTGWIAAPLSWQVLLALLGASVALALVLDAARRWVFARLKL